MKEVCYYLADDGTKFDEEKECLNYEFQQKNKNIIGKDLKLFDDSHKEIANCTFDSIYDAFAVQVRTVESAKFFVEWSEIYGTESPFDLWDIKNKDEDLLGTWVYDALDQEGWMHLDKFKRKVDELYFALQ